MFLKHSAIATSVIAAIALAGCKSDSSTAPPPPTESPTTQGQFIDAAVEGLYYVAKPSGKSGYTDAEGNYNYEEGDTIAFFLGGENGLRIGSTSARSITSPFEATGNFQKALNLARILQTMDDASNGSITLPDTVKSPSASMIAALNNVMLHDLTSATDLLSELNHSDWISEEDALEHLNDSLKGLERGSKAILTDWQRGSGKYLRTVDSALLAKNPSDTHEHLYVHADKLLDKDLFDQVQGMPIMTMRLNEAELLILQGSNDTKLSGDAAKLYLTCIDGADDANYSYDTDNGKSYCDGAEITTPSPKFDIDNTYFQYNLLNPNTESSEDEDEPWEDVKEFGVLYECLADQNCSEAKLTGFSITEYDDSDEQDGSAMQKDKLSTSYDSITGIYTEVKKRTVTSGMYNGRTSESLSFAYLVDSPTAERYVDFKGNWHAVATRNGCDVVATSTYTFDEQGVTVTGAEFESGCETAQISETKSYAELAEMDFWWFTTNGASNESKATLAQLNTTIRWCDKDEDDMSADCADDDVKFNRWEYSPAGKDWDQGTLNRRTLSSDGLVKSTISMYKK